MNSNNLKCPNTLKSFIKRGKNKLDFLSNQNFYKISCDDCEASYVGQRKRKLNTRLHEHISDIKKNTGSPTVITDHRINFDHNFKWNDVRILDCESSYNKRLVSEMIHIKRQKQGLNSSIIDISDESEDELARIRARARFPDTTRLEYDAFQKNDIISVTKNASGVTDEKNTSIIPIIQKRALKPNGFSVKEKRRIANNLLPNKPEALHDFGSKVFCGLYSKDGEFFVTATQDKWMYIYRTNNGNFTLYNQMLAHDVGWSVLDVAFSPDGQHFAYSSWADCLYQCHISDDSIETLPLHPGVRRFCVFSLAFSNNGEEILGGANDRCLYIYSLYCQRRFERFIGHEEDVNCVGYADNSSQIFYSGGDDGLCKVWDRRLVNVSNPSPVGVLAGHRDGITYIDSRGDTRYLITNSKDQCIKLWDTRVFSSCKAQQNARQLIERQDWDYRWQPVPQRLWDRGFLDGDSSIMTYYGHSVRKTLIRCRFSPPNNTGQRYIYTGDSTGRLIIYDLLTGKIVHKAKGHLGCVRDVSWHPFDHNFITSSWDGKICKWEYCEDYNANEYEPPLLRRSERIAARRRAHVLI